VRALLVEDDATIAQFVERGLREAGFAVDRAADGEAGLELALASPYDVAIIDVMLPKRDGLSLIDDLRKRGIATPVLILSAKRSVDDRVRGLQAGGDDYLTKPFAFAELLVRIKALLRRGATRQETVLRVADIELDRLSQQVRRSGKRIELTNKEYSLLEYLMANAGRVLSRTMIIEHVWDQSFDGATNIVDVYVRHLRDKVDEGREANLIRTVRGVGYAISDEQP
jgi:DNA-binding response OmpR family regulator